MSDVELFWNVLRAKWPSPQPPWHELHPQKQMMVISALNTMIQTMEMLNQ